MFTGTVLQSHRKESKREGEIFFFLQQPADTPPQPYLTLHCTLARTASNTQVRASKSTAIWTFCTNEDILSIRFHYFFERLVSAAAAF